MAVTNDQPAHDACKPDNPEAQVPEPVQHPDESQKPIVQQAAAPHKPETHHEKLNEDQAKALHIHNDARHQAPSSFGHLRKDLVWDNKLAANATAYAKKLAHDNAGLKHSTGDQRPGQGENLAWSKPNGSLTDGSKMWVDEKKNYSGQKIGEGDFGSYGHYTQVIWPSTTHVGLGMARANEGGWFVVGRYSPPGNFTGQSAW